MIDFNKWPQIQSAPMVISLNSNLKNQLINCRNTLKHIECCIYFAAQVGRIRNYDFSLMLREANLRAALMEFALIENGITQDNLKAKQNFQPFAQFHETDEPLLHLLRLLRNYELHLTPSTLSPTQIDVFWGNDSVRDVPERYFETTIFRTNDLTLNQLKQLKVAKYYSDSDLTALAAWYNQENKAWGVYNVIFWAAHHAAEKLIQVFV